ncbi:YCF48-related protein [Acidocella sp.]|uniref:WD40/YVTN/BNR-like repeat-containing protein n=1 Tax=Acidocella sp. TaxID=50710 RepID=UPI002624DA36|nr:YCF48-related protein [Acidocella sp.]
MRSVIRLTCLVFLLASGHAFADTLQGPMRLPATVARQPARALLITVMHAGARLLAVGGRGMIIYSDDNGQSWHQAAVPTSETITDAAFADAKHGWAAGAQGVVLHTDDGGATWQLQLTGDQVIPLMNTAAAQYAAANPGTAASALAVRRAGIFTQAGPNKPFLTILPLSAQSAIIFGAYRMTVMTTDGGKTWEDWSLHVGDPVSHGIFDVARMGNAIYLTGESGVVLRSTDQGQSFTMLASPDPSTMFGILATPKGTLLTFGVAGEVFRSTDNGASWAQASISSDADLTAGVVLSSGEILVVSEDGGVFASQDDGQNFKSIGLNEGMALYGVTQAPNGDVVFAGSNGVRVVPASAITQAKS